MKYYTVFAGVNGSGKTSMYKAIYFDENRTEKRINTDEMVAKVGSWKDSSLQMKCAREAVNLIKSYLSEGISFNQETTLSGKCIVRNIKLAKENGFYIVMNYIGLSSPEIAKERVKLRVSKGGHGIPDEDIERRYYDSLKNLKDIIKVCDEINVYDNTEIFKQIIYFKHGKVSWSDKKVPMWANDIL